MCAQVRKIYMKTELQCVLSRPCQDATYIIFSPPRFPKTGGSITVKDLERVCSNLPLRQNYLIFIENFQKGQEN